MTPNEYQKLAARTLSDPEEIHGDKDRPAMYEELLTLTLTTKLAGEVGELCELIGKSIGHGVTPNNFLDLVEKELGDGFWYLAAIATMYGLNVGDIMVRNIVKLKERYPQGFVEGGGIR